MAENFILLPISELRLNDDNPRLIKEERFAHLVQSLIDFPEMMRLRPAVVDEAGLVLGGNMRSRAKAFLLELSEAEKSERLAQAVAHRHAEQGPDYNEAAHRQLLAELFDVATVPVTRAVGLSEAQKREFIIKDNAGFGEWDWDQLANGAWGDVPTLTSWGVDIPPKWANEADQEQAEKEFDGPIETEHKCPNCGHEF
jgi:hypothetical protein